MALQKPDLMIQLTLQKKNFVSEVVRGLIRVYALSPGEEG
ncbi:hypothetical protein COP1_047088 [Malus domestica]